MDGRKKKNVLLISFVHLIIIGAALASLNHRSANRAL